VGENVAMGLSPRETAIVRSIAAGRTTKEIASTLGIAHSTVEWHISNVLVKLEAASRAEAVAIALSDGLLERDRQAGHPRRRRARRRETDRVIGFDLLGLHLGQISVATGERDASEEEP